MEILIISDTHGNKEKLNTVCNKHQWEHLLYIGDGISDLGNLIHHPNVHYVKGNCDIFSSAPIEKLIDIQNFKILITHGHTFKVKSDTNELINHAKSLNADICIYGHTHKSDISKHENLTLINPGSLSTTRGGNLSYAVLYIEEKKFEIKKFIL